MDSRTQFGNGSLLLATGTIVLAMTASVMMLTLPTPVTKSTAHERRQLDAAILRNARIRERYIEFLPESVETRRRPAERRERDRVTTSNKSASMDQTELAQIQRQLSQLDSALSQIQQQQQMLVQQQLDSRKAALSQNSPSSPSASPSPQQFSMESAVREHSGATATVQTVSSQSAASSHPASAHPVSATDDASANAGSSDKASESASVTLEQTSTSDGFSDFLSAEATSTTAPQSGTQESTQEANSESPQSGERSGDDPVGSDPNHIADVRFPEFPQPEASESSAPAPQLKIDEEFPSPFEPNVESKDADTSSPDGDVQSESDLSIPDSLMPADTEDSLVPVMIPAGQETSSSRLLRTPEDDIPFIAALGWSEDDAESLELDELTIPPADDQNLIRAVVTGPAAEIAAPLIERTNREQASTLPDAGEFWNTAIAAEQGVPALELRPVPHNSSASFESQLPVEPSMSTASPAIFEYEYSPQLTYDTNFQSAPMDSFPSSHSGVKPSQGPRNSANHSAKRRGFFRIPKFRFSGGSGQSEKFTGGPVHASATSRSFEPHSHHDMLPGPPMMSQYSPAPIVHRGVHSVSSGISTGPISHYAPSPGDAPSVYPGMTFNDGFIEPGYYETAPHVYATPQPSVPYVMVPTIVMPDFDFVDFEMPEFGGQTFHRAHSAIRFASHSSALP